MTSRELGGDGLAVSLTISLALGLALIALGLLVVPSATAIVYTNGGASSGILELMVYSCFSILDRKSTRLNSSHVRISYAVFCLKKKKGGNLLPAGYRR